MRVRSDIVVAGVIILLAAYAVFVQLGRDPLPNAADEPIRPLAIGEKLEIDFTLSDVNDVPQQRNLMAWYGRTATVLYTWSVPCPCVDVVDRRLMPLFTKYNRHNAGVEWVALAGEPNDTREQVRKKMGRLRAFYKMLLDPEQRVCRRLGLVHATMVAVLDGEGRLLYRGAVDGDYDEGRAEFLAEALEAVVAGRPVPSEERPWVYGCEFAVPESCIEYQREGVGVPEEAPAAERP